MNIRLCLRTLVAALALVVFSLSPLAVGGRLAAAGPDEALEAYKRGDFAAAHELWLPRAVAGESEAQFRVGVLYDNGEGVDKDLQQALNWYQKAADGGYADAQYAIGIHHERGEGLPRDLAAAERWYLKAANQEHVISQFALSVHYLNGEGPAQDYAKAFRWLSIVAEQGYAIAQINLAFLYREGLGIEQDTAAAAEWWPRGVGAGGCSRGPRAHRPGKCAERTHLQARRKGPLPARGQAR